MIWSSQSSDLNVIKYFDLFYKWSIWKLNVFLQACYTKIKILMYKIEFYIIKNLIKSIYDILSTFFFYQKIF